MCGVSEKEPKKKKSCWQLKLATAKTRTDSIFLPPKKTWSPTSKKSPWKPSKMERCAGRKKLKKVVYFRVSASLRWKSVSFGTTPPVETFRKRFIDGPLCSSSSSQGSQVLQRKKGDIFRPSILYFFGSLLFQRGMIRVISREKEKKIFYVAKKRKPTKSKTRFSSLLP